MDPLPENIIAVDSLSAPQSCSCVDAESASSNWKPSLKGTESVDMPDVPETQEAVVTPEIEEDLNMSLQTIDVRVPAPGEAVLRILYSGICRSDITFSVSPQWPTSKHNHIAGHQGIGRVVSCSDSSLLGRLYGVRYLGSHCQSCTYCLRGIPTSCPFQLNVPIQISGTFQHFATIPISCLVPLPKNLFDGSSSIDPALYTSALCSGSTALVSLRAARISPGDVVVVVGVLGAIGHLTGMLAKQVQRARVIGVDLAAKTRAVTQEHQDYQDYCEILLGAPESYEEGYTWQGFHERLLQACAQLRRGHGRNGGVARAAEAVIVTSSSVSSFQRLDEYVCDGGTIVCAGVPKGRSNMVSLPIHSVVERNLHLAGNLMGGHREALEVMQYIRSGQIMPRITKLALQEVPEQMQRMADNQTIGKLVVYM
ncbi:GroES-like protein [Aspergillus japonicus CBS 114.51]|uniref:GroES-like protein n=1 Tax=Aspergillus japonicus CBS 114.51 TaxID=1448312 RepID=A0A8T8XHW0_ASPJA|nr:GroES-like protein [Aspergillus japonicus CBS 114.51]RAH87508.1 GroES-like protein [Aspergillus japonicus CBS 114.51]